MMKASESLFLSLMIPPVRLHILPVSLKLRLRMIGVTEIIGSGKVDMGFKAMIHTLAAKARRFPITSVGSLLDEPFTGVAYLKDSGITTDFRSLRARRLDMSESSGRYALLCTEFVDISVKVMS